MYGYLSQFSSWISQPFTAAAYSTDLPLLAAFFLGIVGSVAPCQITANLGAMSYLGNRYVQAVFSIWEMILYVIGKVLVFSVFDLLFLLFDQSISNQSISLFTVARKMLLFLVVAVLWTIANSINLNREQKSTMQKGSEQKEELPRVGFHPILDMFSAIMVILALSWKPRIQTVYWRDVYLPMVIFTDGITRCSHAA